MLGKEIVEHIDSTLSAPTAGEAFGARLEQFAAGNSSKLESSDKAAMMSLAEDYVRSVGNLLIECDRTAITAGIQRFTAPILQTAANYFLNPNDYIPDEKGLYGLLDDAYLACRFVARISQLVTAERGFPLLDTSLDQHSAIIRILIGEPLASRLDQDVESTLQAVLSQIQMEQLQQLQLQQNWNKWAHKQNVINTEAEIMAIASGSF